MWLQGPFKQWEDLHAGSRVTAFSCFHFDFHLFPSLNPESPHKAFIGMLGDFASETTRI